MFISIVLAGVNNCSSAIPFIAVERDVLYREKFAGMYLPWVHSVAQVNNYLVEFLSLLILAAFVLIKKSD